MLPWILLSLAASASAGGYLDYNGFRYQLADPSVDSTAVDLLGDDCAAFPCSVFTIPATCNISFPTTDMVTVAQSKGWSTSYLVTLDGFYPTDDWMLPPAAFSIVDAVSTPGSVTLTDAGWHARIVLRCKIPCPSGSVLVGTACAACPVGKWSVYSGATCNACTNAPASSAYTSNGADSSNCSFTCTGGTYLQALPSPFLYIGDQYAIRAVDQSGTVSTVYKPLSTDPTYGATFAVWSTLNRNIVYTGYFTVNRVDLSTGTFTNVVGSTTVRGVTDGVGTAATFNSIVGGALWQSETYLLALDGMNCNLRQITLATRAVTTVLGAGNCGYQEGVGGKLRYPTDIVLNAAGDTAYISDAGNYRVRAVTLSTMALSTLVGNGVGGNTDGIGATASVDPRYLALSSDQTILYVKTINLLRMVVLSTGSMTTLPPASLGASMFQIAISQLSPNVVYYAALYSVNSLIISSGQSSLIAGGSVASQTDGPAGGFMYPNFMALVNETLTRNFCATCTICPTGSYGICNATGSLCAACPLGSYTTASGQSVCTLCPVGQYGASSGLCAACAPGSYSNAGATVCANCSAGTFMIGLRCANCSGGFYSTTGATSCSPCANLIGNATYLANQPGTNATNCPLACRAGFNYAPGLNACSQCAVGQWSASGSTACSACTSLPTNSTYAGVGTSALNCPFACNGGYYQSGAACLPCAPGTMGVLGTSCATCPAGTYSAAAATNCTACAPGFYALSGWSNCTACAAGTRILAGVCTPCVASSYSGSNATACSACAAGLYSLAGATACTTCPNANAYTVYLGRSASSSCPFYCTVGAYLLNRTVCTPCANGTYAAAIGATRCTNCALGYWSGSGSTVCTACSALTLTAANGTGTTDYAFIAKAGWGITSIVCVP